MSKKSLGKIARPTRPLADVNVLRNTDGSLEIVATFMPDPDIIVGEGNAKAFIALDASASMKKAYGWGGPFGGDPNYVELVARKLATVLSDVTSSGEVSGIYWAVSPKGDNIEEIGELDEEGWSKASIDGPKKEKWGKGTRILPVAKYGVETAAKNSDWTMGVIITDGIIEDVQECISYCMQIGKEMADGSRKPIKLILIGAGEEIDQGQMLLLDDMFEGTDLEDKVDIWSHGLVTSVKDEADILAILYGELVDEDTIVASTGYVEDSNGKQIKTWADGLPGKLRFELPKGQTEFVIHAGNHEVRQDISEVL